jgi:hypothetical protein
MTIFMIDIAFERELFIVHFLKVSLVVKGELNGLWNSFLQIYLNVDSSTRLQAIVRLNFINIIPKGVSNSLKGFIVPTM